MDTAKVDEYKKLKSEVERLNARIQELNLRQKIVQEELKKKMAEKGISTLDELKALIAEQEGVLNAETEKFKTWIAEVTPVLEQLERV